MRKRITDSDLSSNFKDVAIESKIHNSFQTAYNLNAGQASSQSLSVRSTST
uniref:Uncharacterized protein n=1 Tax=Amphimedon queenslandica TaxID=400682 RepID=A0A1X7VSU2_AMPQE